MAWGTGDPPVHEPRRLIAVGSSSITARFPVHRDLAANRGAFPARWCPASHRWSASPPVTPLTVEAVSFSGRLNVILTDKPCPQNVDGRVLVRVRGVPAPPTAELGPGGPVLLGDVPAGRAALGGVAGVDLDDDPSGTFSLDAQHPEEHPHPASWIDLFSPDRPSTLSFSTAIRSWPRTSPSAVLRAWPSRCRATPRFPAGRAYTAVTASRPWALMSSVAVWQQQPFRAGARRVA